MNFLDYQQLASITSGHDGLQYPVSHDRPTCAFLGLCGEAGEAADAWKKIQYHGHPLDIKKLQSELGDVLWYISEACTSLGLSLDMVATCNIDKLKTRYGNKFSTAKSLNRPKE